MPLAGLQLTSKQAPANLHMPPPTIATSKKGRKDKKGKDMPSGVIVGASVCRGSPRLQPNPRASLTLKHPPSNSGTPCLGTHCPPVTMQVTIKSTLQERGEGIESKCRQRPVEENLAIWKEMVAGSPVGLTNCMRFKISVDNPNKAMRDPVAYRCNLIPHIRTGSKYKVVTCSSTRLLSCTLLFVRSWPASQVPCDIHAVE